MRAGRDLTVLAVLVLAALFLPAMAARQARPAVLNLGPNEWFTVAARDNVPNDPLVPGDSTDLKSVIFKVKGSDLAAFRSGQITIEQARERVTAEEN